jgi:hypothetical protein
MLEDIGATAVKHRFGFVEGPSGAALNRVVTLLIFEETDSISNELSLNAFPSSDFAAGWCVTMSRQEVVTAELSISRFALTVCDFSPDIQKLQNVDRTNHRQSINACPGSRYQSAFKIWNCMVS